MNLNIVNRNRLLFIAILLFILFKWILIYFQIILLMNFLRNNRIALKLTIILVIIAVLQTWKIWFVNYLFIDLFLIIYNHLFFILAINLVLIILYMLFEFFFIYMIWCFWKHVWFLKIIFLIVECRLRKLFL